MEKKTKLDSLEHFLKLYQKSVNSESEYVKVIKQYLFDPIHSHKKAGTMNEAKSIITEYFARNDSPLHFKFDAKNRYSTEVCEKSLSLEDLLKMLTVGQPSLIQKAVFICKFHRGLDNSTFCDRFNFEAWTQLVDYFGTEVYMKWDLSKCPVPIKLARVKTRYSHIGFLDRDAITSLQTWLKVREEKTGRPIQEGDPIFLNRKGKPIREIWIRDSFFTIAKRAGILKRLDGRTRNAFNMDSHELRDLLKSTLIDSGCRPDVANHVIGHMPDDSYSKQHILYQENLRLEFAKASRRLNIFSKVSEYLKDNDERTAVLQRKLEILTKEKEEKVSSLESKVDTLTKSVIEILTQLPNKPKAKELLELAANVTEAQTPQKFDKATYWDTVNKYLKKLIEAYNV